MIIHPFKPVIFKESRVLILGSFPSVKSREVDFY
ncbi:MAG: DNA-deoxyinosine glycosylase, partial [Bacilli bacterium]|nr:DNA-deoxyinosine glycosylase [Bacilli bacterium]